MEFDDLLKSIQELTNKIPLLIIGSGASAPYNLPTMESLGHELKKTLSFSDEKDQEQFEKFKGHLGQHNNLEKALNDTHLPPLVVTEIIKKTWDLITIRDLAAYDQLINDAQNFPLAILIRHLITTSDKKLSIITTNYDRLLEYAASMAGAFICTGYTQNYYGRYSNSIHQIKPNSLKGFRGSVNIWKVHGSLDWFKQYSGANIHLPLRRTIPPGVEPSIVTPGIDKYLKTHNEPYRSIIAQADQEIEGANGYLCIGYGFNDIHIQPKIIEQIKNSKPILVITRKLTENTKELIIENKCKKYILIEEDINPNNTRIYSSTTGQFIMENTAYWQLENYITLIKS